MKQDAELWDLVIVGGGMTGALLALALRSLTSAKIALIEAQAVSADHPGFDARSIALAQGSVEQLKRWQLWPLLAPLTSPINTIHVSDRGNFGMTTLEAKAPGIAAFGQVLGLEDAGRQLQQALVQADIDFVCPDTVAQLSTHADYQQLTLSSGRQLRSRLLVAADGAQSFVRQCLGLEQQLTDFNQSAIIANISLDRPHQGQAFERFTAQGPLALLPMAKGNGKCMSLVWAMSPAQQAEYLNLADTKFLAVLQAAFGYRAGAFTRVSQRHGYPLIMSVMPRPIYHRCVFVGNAAQTLHPIAGQGFNLGLRDIAGLVSVLTPVLNAGGDAGSAALTHDYLAARTQDRQATLLAIETLVRGFSNQDWPLVLGRNIGLRLLSWCPPLKRPVVASALGWPQPTAAH
ncbi:2-octaprenyl-6-methoxyphenyl hydroxylase [Shewanella sp. NIFS-20-20]|uniref:2-octaprenyl-6-methoxyphenyl hydroxylase n=1 Tax=Shewanella sp. NIFS-20-20 TaxID=2853806 RepID=UPI001C4742D9|nr:2-octaprenyl-6-methoxyphenyl hydroxylase [Shewanella sp. NIFS-20-20]MBV7317368.1 2-octaprenyl-6-methoxyphenyl hydroxylase [Shewanella sp. NIFS-20-20]